MGYTAAVESIDVPDAKGNPAARLVSFAYTDDDPHDEATRPVMFVFNGGPITASLWLHIGVMGPKRVAVPADLTADPNTYQLVDNIYSPLDVADLVFIDPASTGYSRVLPGTAPESYFSVVSDAQQVTAFIAAWLTAAPAALVTRLPGWRKLRHHPRGRGRRTTRRIAPSHPARWSRVDGAGHQHH